MLTTSELATAAGTTPRGVLAIAKRRGVAPARTIGRVHLWSREQVAAVRPGKKGWPKGRARITTSPADTARSPHRVSPQAATPPVPEA